MTGLQVISYNTSPSCGANPSFLPGLPTLSILVPTGQICFTPSHGTYAASRFHSCCGEWPSANITIATTDIDDHHSTSCLTYCVLPEDALADFQTCLAASETPFQLFCRPTEPERPTPSPPLRYRKPRPLLHADRPAEPARPDLRKRQTGLEHNPFSQYQPESLTWTDTTRAPPEETTGTGRDAVTTCTTTESSRTTVATATGTKKTTVMETKAVSSTGSREGSAGVGSVTSSTTATATASATTTEKSSSTSSQSAAASSTTTGAAVRLGVGKMVLGAVAIIGALMMEG